MFALFWQTYSQAQGDFSRKALGLIKFAQNINYPSGVVGNDFIIGVIGEPSVVDAINTVAGGQSIKGKRLITKHLTSAEDIRTYPIVYITNTSTTIFPSEVFRRLEGRPCLVVSELAQYFENNSGSDINFVQQGAQWRYEINPDKIKAKRLSFNDNLIKDAIRVKEPPKVVVEEKKVYVPTPVISDDIVKNRKIIADANADAEAARKKLQAVLNGGGLTPEQARALYDSIKQRTSLFELEIEKQKALQKAKDEQNKRFIEVQNRQRETATARQRLQLTILLAILLLVSSLAALFYYFSARRKRIIDALEQTRKQLANKVQEVNQKNDLLEKSSRELEDKNREIGLKNDQLLTQTEELEDQNRKITDSIRYAMTIQQAMLPTDTFLKTIFEDYFIVYQPKDIVSGDFYWVSRQEGKTFVAVVDCTGHGVPGAFMSAIGTDLLNEIVNEKKVFNPAKVLERLHLGIYERLRQGDSNNRDGMDVCFCTINPANNEQCVVTFAGAKRPLYYTHNNQIQRIGGDSKYIGGILKEKQDFTTHEVILKKGDILYLTSDGYTDAPNAKRVKYGTQKFQDLLEKVHHQPLDHQRHILTTELEQYQIDTEPRDDVTILGVKI
ncbi:MAG: YfiR/HmsC family protein [Microscillaceae bacterium]|nr:YfiR/HmsC family protein [Microscillaceae bacterium]